MFRSWKIKKPTRSFEKNAFKIWLFFQKVLFYRYKYKIENEYNTQVVWSDSKSTMKSKARVERSNFQLPRFDSSNFKRKRFRKLKSIKLLFLIF